MGSLLSYIAQGGLIAGVSGLLAMLLASGDIGFQYRLGLFLAFVGFGALLVALVAGFITERSERRRHSMQEHRSEGR